MAPNRMILNGILFLAVIMTPARSASAPADAVDQLLSLIPPHASAALVVHDLRGHISRLQRSSLAQGIVSSAGIKKIADSQEFHKIHAIVDYLCREANTTPHEVFEQVISDGIVFAILPSEGKDSDKEHSLLLIRPAQDELLRRIIDRLNEIQLKSGELSQVQQRSHQKQNYFQRRKATETFEYYLLESGVFAFSTSEQAIQSVLESLAKDPSGREKTPFQAARKALGLESALAALLINPRALDPEIEAKHASSPPPERPFLNWFLDHWKKLKAIAAYLKLEGEVEIGLAISSRVEELNLRPPHQSDLWSVIPADSCFAAAGKQKLTDLLTSLSPLLPDDGRRSLQNLSEQLLNLLFGKDKLPIVLDSLGPNWGLWIEASNADEWPAGVLAVEIRSPPQEDASRIISQGILYLFQTIRVMHYARGMEQISLVESDLPNFRIHSLSGNGLFPPGVQPSFAMKEGYLILATNPAPIRRFQRPAPASPQANSEVRLASLSVTELQRTLTRHGPALMRLLTSSDEQTTHSVSPAIQQLMDWLVIFRRVDIIARSQGQSLQVGIKLTPAKTQDSRSPGNNQ